MDKRKEGEILTKCRGGGGGEERIDAGLQVNGSGVLGFFLPQIFASLFLLFPSKIASSPSVNGGRL